MYLSVNDANNGPIDGTGMVVGHLVAQRFLSADVDGGVAKRCGIVPWFGKVSVNPNQRCDYVSWVLRFVLRVDVAKCRTSNWVT